jgi:hypothetical protein
MTTIKEIADFYGMTELEYTTMREKCVAIRDMIKKERPCTQARVYSEIEKIAVSTKEAIMITAGVCALSWGVI